MPTGVYHRTPEMLAAAKRCLDKGRTPAVRKKAAKKLKEIAADPNWRAKVSAATQEAMHDPEIRRRHLQGLADHNGFSLDPNPNAPELKNPGILQEYIDRFWSRVNILGPGDCWKWQGATPRHYGHYHYGPDGTSCNRFVLMLKLGRFLVGDEQALHNCDNPPCCNPKHIFLGNNAINVRDKMDKGRLNLRYGEDHHDARLTNAKARKIRKMHVQNGGLFTTPELAEFFRVSRGIIKNVIQGKTYRNV